MNILEALKNSLDNELNEAETFLDDMGHKVLTKTGYCVVCKKKVKPAKGKKKKKGKSEGEGDA